MCSLFTGKETYQKSLIAQIRFHRLDLILGKAGSKAKDVYDSKQSLASRIVKVERTVGIV